MNARLFWESMLEPDDRWIAVPLTQCLALLSTVPTPLLERMIKRIETCKTMAQWEPGLFHNPQILERPDRLLVVLQQLIALIHAMHAYDRLDKPVQIVKP